jgi:DNA-directed RNA polymerase specialized sigma24 family protein
VHRRDQREFDAFVRAVADRLLHLAELLTGDPGRAERRVRRALARTYLKWRHSEEPDPTRIMHRALMAGYLDPWRPMPWRPRRGASPWRGRRFAGETDEAAGARDEVLRDLDRLTRLERAVLVLRAYGRLDEFDTAQALSVPEESVRRALGRAAGKMPKVGRAGRGVDGEHRGRGDRGGSDSGGWDSGGSGGVGGYVGGRHVRAVTWSAEVRVAAEER